MRAFVLHLALGLVAPLFGVLMRVLWACASPGFRLAICKELRPAYEQDGFNAPDTLDVTEATTCRFLARIFPMGLALVAYCALRRGQRRRRRLRELG